MKFHPSKRGGGEGSLNHAEGGGGRQSFGAVFQRKLEVLAILNGVGGGGGCCKKFQPAKRGAQIFTLS